MKSRVVVLVAIVVFIAATLFTVFTSTKSAVAKVVCVDKYNYASIVPCSDQNAIDRDMVNTTLNTNQMSSGGNMTPASA